MATQLEICNLALLRLGALPILDLEDNSKKAQALLASYDVVLDIVLRDHPWNFAVTRAVLTTPESTDPVFGYTYAYALPDDCLRVLGLASDGPQVDPGVAYAVEKGLILTNETTVNLLYIARIEDPDLYDAVFCSALATRLAAEIAYHLTDSPAIAGQLLEKYLKVELPAARSVDAQENQPQVYETTTWDDART